VIGTAIEWLNDGRAQPLPAETSAAFDRYLLSLPWGISSLDWSRMDNAEVINLAQSDAFQLRAWLSRTGIGSHSHTAIWYSLEEGGLILPTSIAIEHLDELYRFAPGVRYAFGVTVEDGSIKPAFRDLLEYGRGDLLTAVTKFS